MEREKMEIGIVRTDRLHMTAFTVASPPANPATGQVAYFSNGAAGSPILAVYNGTSWLRQDTGAAIAES